MEELYAVSGQASKNRDRQTLQGMLKAAAQGGRKRIFLGLLAISCVFVCLLLFLFFVLPWVWSGAVWLESISIFIGAFGIFFLAWLCLTIIYHIYSGRDLPGIIGARHLCVRFFLPLMELAGPIMGADRNLVRRSFIKVNNEFVCAHKDAVKPEELLVLLPHCMQSSQCARKLGMDVANCAACGKCQMGHIKAMANTYGFRVAVATGGTIARRIVAAMRPKRIIAIACERDLAAGIQDTYPLPVFGILNERPHGPCLNTRASLASLEFVVAYFLGSSRQE